MQKAPAEQAVGTARRNPRIRQEIPFLQRLIARLAPAQNASVRRERMPWNRPKKTRRKAAARIAGRPARPRPKRGPAGALPAIGELARTRAEAEAAIADARKSHERLREAIDILPQGIVFLDGEGRYILWNRKYAEIYSRSADLFKPGARLADTIRVGVARGDYPEAIGREEEWIAERLARLT